ncbi:MULTISPECIES: hypothetical protein [unclassified Paracoccus (in: a-proteobacteria)]|uniref:hypothetical protein n=1 Tax=unclassified Paracoccus (in: a-proteobacteria) TaxID=2688777 RepID=UPI0021E1567A|nr:MULTISPECIES: hypothetical protein [unclassified Paracoccus (in: a-proteobacteria)]UXU73710.1 hypothetical protein GB879_007090 [Paracoccus sp. SMMA_5]UXU74366.1 hypothetical protein GB879_010700 [Paracoccus sp. SMMA_5]UXU79600.1 hypothetical protein GB880_007080 [Paracoccus sp. SMMA_5_TC]UXU80256.1 hypothetical protein GB880_010675 [Paracoccus sp. SMMA_5_TC]
MTVIYAARTAEGIWTGARYDRLTPAIRVHHRQYGETLHPVGALTDRGGDVAPDWQASPAEPEALRAGLVVSRYQLRAALEAAGRLAAADAAMAAAPEPLHRDAWTGAAEYRRSSPLIAALGTALDLGAAELDALFLTAAGIEA